jgi:glycerophosphoryl diester phosphodiesterase
VTAAPSAPLPHWPYPRWIAHRGAGKLAPENTLAAFRLGAHHGYRMYECDVKLSADGVPFLLHDATLERTTTGSGTASERTWGELAQLDAGGWHSRAYAGESLMTLEALARHCHAQGHLLNIEIKPTPGDEARTGQIVAHAAARLWQGAAVLPLLTSFQPASLVAARAAVPALPLGLLLAEWRDDALAFAQEQACVAIVCQWELWTAERLAQVHALGMRALSYTVNDADAAQRLLALGTDGIITDRVDLFAPTL